MKKSQKKPFVRPRAMHWNAYLAPIKEEAAQVISLLDAFAAEGADVSSFKNELASIKEPIRKDILVAAKKAIR
ncbi:MAG: hypothetical protein QM758_10185 [Armatimonas sp.]